MIRVPVYNQAGEKTEEIELPEAVFGVKPKAAVVHQVYTAWRANAREPWADTKDRGEVRGGGRKPWRQKGTGRARHGSIRSPIWKGGGVTFGPLSIRNYKQKVNKKMNQLAVKMCLSDKAVEDKLVVVGDWPVDGKTKTMAGLLAKLPGSGKSSLLLLAEKNENVRRSIRNLSKIDWQRASDVNLVDLLNHQYVLVTRDGIKVLEKRLIKQ